MQLLNRMVMLVLIVLLSACSEPPAKKEKPPRPVKIQVIEELQEQKQRVFPGKVYPSKRADLAFDVAGEVIEFPVKDGEMVEKQQLLARLDPRKFTEQVDRAKADYILANAQFDRAKQLVGKGFISRADHDTLESKWRVAKANLETAQRNLDDSVLKAPFKGVIARTFVENREQVQKKQKILSIQDVDVVELRFQVPESVVSRIKKDGAKQVSAEFPAYPGKMYPLTLKEFETEADPETQTFTAVFIMNAPKEFNVLPGMTANIYTLIDEIEREKSGYQKIPSSAVVADQTKQAYVWIVMGEQSPYQIKRQDVQVGNLSGGMIEVISGLKPGDRVVVAGANFLSEGLPVTILKSDTDQQ